MTIKKEKSGNPVRLKKYRLEHPTQVTIYSLASAMGVNSSTVSYWENGKKYPRHDMIIFLEDFFGKPYRDLFTDLSDEETREVEETIRNNAK